MTMKTKFKQIFTAILLASTSAQAGTYVINSSESKVQFLANGKPGFLKIKGTGATASGEVIQDGEKFSGDIKVDLKPLVTGMDLRDSHMHEKYLQTKAHQFAVLSLTSLKGGNGDCSFTGRLTLKGAEKPISGTCDISGVGTPTAKVEAKFNVKLSDYPEIGVPSHLGITVADNVDVTAEIVANLKK